MQSAHYPEPERQILSTLLFVLEQETRFLDEKLWADWVGHEWGDRCANTGEMVLLLHWSMLNYAAVVKILKKHGEFRHTNPHSDDPHAILPGDWLLLCTVFLRAFAFVAHCRQAVWSGSSSTFPYNRIAAGACVCVSSVPAYRERLGS
jgi:hypothetical protein